jgi:Glycosyl-4,4'-diaponeurosporenoate acyltransferase
VLAAARRNATRRNVNASTSRRADILRLLAVAASFALSLFLFQRAMPFSLTSPWFQLMPMLCVLGLAGVAQPIWPLRMPRALRAIRAWEADGRLYRSLGVAAFGALLRRTPLRLLNSQVYLCKHCEDLVRLSAQLESAEAAHLWAGAVLVPYMAYAFVAGMWRTVLCFTIVQVIGNAYPMMHLRATRSRVDRYASKMSLRRARNA